MKQLLLFTLIIFASKSAISQWTSMSTPASYHLYAINAVTEDVIYAGGYGGSLVKTTDAGANWEAVPYGTTDWVKDIHFFNPLEGWITTTASLMDDPAQLLKTTDGGQTWATVLNSEGYTNMSWLSQSVGFVGTQNGKMYSTSDGGVNWTPLSLPTTEYVGDLQFLNSQDGFAVSTDYHLHRTSDGGNTWQSFYHPGISDIHFHNKDVGFCVDSYGRIGKTTDGGETFTYWETPFPNYKLRDIKFDGMSNGYVVGGLDCSNGSCTTKPVLLTTTDGGNTWYNDLNHTIVNQDKGFYRIDVTPNGTPYLAGSHKLVHKNATLAGLSNVSNEETAVIIPNPNSGDFSVSLPEGVKALQVVSQSGQLLFEKNSGIGVNSFVSLQDVAPGMYFLQVQLKSDISKTIKFIVE